MFDVDFEHKYRYWLRSVSVFIAIIFISLTVMLNPELRAGFFERPNKQDYDCLTSYADTYAKTLDKNAISDKNVEITVHYTSEDKVVITVQEMRCKVEAVYPMSITVIDEGKYEVKIFYDKGVYLASSNLKNIVHYIIGTIIMVCIFTFATYILICLVCYIVKEKRKK